MQVSLVPFVQSYYCCVFSAEGEGNSFCGLATLCRVGYVLPPHVVCACDAYLVSCVRSQDGVVGSFRAKGVVIE